MKVCYLFFLSLINQCNSFSLQRRQLLTGALGTSQSISLINSKNNLEMKNEPLQQMQGEVGILQETNNEIYFYAPFNQKSCFELRRLLDAMNLKMITLHNEYKIKPPPIHLHIQSEGGSLYHTLYIMDLIQNLDTDVYTYVDGFAASAATLVSVVGKKRFITKNSLMLVHQLSGSDSGKFNELQDQMNNMSVLMNMIVNTYLEHTKIKKEDLIELLKKDLWLNAETCLNYGLVDKII